ncbi:type VI secretion system baseplate subunit TssE [Orrella daihaiensis]|uniref:Type VI secretion system baseplate subunit TssE n=1 Tax=Orrella daihaiensis TaxID=2782176 RepID=A0ABY4AJ21_9BURK|nr:type VI secretion system baseplate subunit TssE [Orrella daihaiensis]UOD50078.1 type VI secretion system baseplate subunit TssE [Orrella daihaiensis]
MPSLRLSERLTYAVNPRLTAGMTADSLGKKSIVDHLTRLLNTRQGSVPIDPNYGMSDLSNIAGSFAMGTTESICEEVAIQISRYESRVTNPRITVNNSTDERNVIALRFDVSARLADAQRKPTDEMLSLLMRIDASGRVHLTPRQDF